jgi:hypothetical protein
MKQNWGIKVIVLLAAIFAVVSFGSVEAKAAAQYKRVAVYNDTTVKHGQYYFTRDNEKGTVSISKEKDGEYTETPISSTFLYSDGKQCYYMDNNYVIYNYKYKTGKNKKLKKMKEDGDAVYTIGGVYKNYIYVNKSSFDRWRLWTYTYNIKTGEYRKIATDCSVSDISGGYVVGCNEYRSDVSPYKITLYKIKSDGSFKKVKVISKYGYQGDFVNGKLYYLIYPQNSLKETTLYRANEDGSSAKKIVTFKSNNKYGEVMVYDITAKNCYVYKDGTTYLYTYKTKKLKKVS